MYDGCLKAMFSKENDGTMSVECFYFDSEGMGAGTYSEGDSTEDLVDALLDFAEGLFDPDGDDEDDIVTAYDELAEDYDELLEDYQDLYNQYQELKSAYDILHKAAKEQEAKSKVSDTKLKEEDEAKLKEKAEPKMSEDELAGKIFQSLDDFYDYLLSHYNNCK
jgi:hypothetical protein